MPSHINEPSLPEPTTQFTCAVLVDDHDFLPGIASPDIPGSEMALRDVAAETRVVMASIRILLALVGPDMGDVVPCDVHLVDLDDMDEKNAIYAPFFAEGHLPARTTTQSDMLADGGLVEIACMARRKQA